MSHVLQWTQLIDVSLTPVNDSVNGCTHFWALIWNLTPNSLLSSSTYS
jgi:hypothetical protein